MRTLRYTEAINKKNGLLEKISFRDFKVSTPFEWLLDYSSSSVYVEIKEGFITNFGSIPRLLRIFLDPTKYIAYILHDYLYSKDARILIIYENEGDIREYSRKEADIILREAIKVEQRKYRYYKILSPILFLERWAIYLGVRAGGFLYYKKD